MRSRPKIAVYLQPRAPYPGTTLNVEARFASKSETPVESVTFELYGTERFTIPRGKSSISRSCSHIRLKAEHPAAIFTPGTHTYKARFNLPHKLPPRYSGTYSSVDYTLEVRASIPWWPDAVGRFDIPISPPQIAVSRAPGVFVSRSGGAVGGELYAEMSLASTVVAAGEEISGTVAFTNAGKERGLRVALVAYEHLFAHGDFWSGGSVDETREVRRWAFTLADSPPPDGAQIPFRFTVTKDTVPSYTSTLTELLWRVEVTAHRLLTSRPVLRVPMTIAPFNGAKRDLRTSAPLVGRARRAQSFTRVGARHALAYDQEQDCLHGTVRGTYVRIAVESRPDGKLVTSARLTWPSLGIRLLLEPSSWTDAFSSRDITIGFSKFDDKFHVESRVVDQARALFNQDLCQLLTLFDEVRAEDDGASLSVAMAITDEQPLATFVERVLLAVQAFERGAKRIPPPPELAPHADAWRAFAEKVGGRFEPGRGAILDGTLGLERIEMTLSWTDDGKLDATTVCIPLGSRIDPDAISPAAKNLAKAIKEPEERQLDIGEEAISLRILRLVPDPSELDTVLESLVRLAHAVRGRGAAGPFRS